MITTYPCTRKRGKCPYHCRHGVRRAIGWCSGGRQRIARTWFRETSSGHLSGCGMHLRVFKHTKGWWHYFWSSHVTVQSSMEKKTTTKDGITHRISFWLPRHCRSSCRPPSKQCRKPGNVCKKKKTTRKRIIHVCFRLTNNKGLVEQWPWPRRQQSDCDRDLRGRGWIFRWRDLCLLWPTASVQLSYV